MMMPDDFYYPLPVSLAFLQETQPCSMLQVRDDGTIVLCSSEWRIPVADGSLVLV